MLVAYLVLPVARAVLARTTVGRSGQLALSSFCCPSRRPCILVDGASRFALLRNRWGLLLSHGRCAWLPGGAGHGGQNCPWPRSCSAFGDVSPMAFVPGPGVWGLRVLSGRWVPKAGARALCPRLPGALCPLPGRHQTVGVGRRPLVLACVALVTKGRDQFFLFMRHLGLSLGSQVLCVFVWSLPHSDGFAAFPFGSWPWEPCRLSSRRVQFLALPGVPAEGQRFSAVTLPNCPRPHPRSSPGFHLSVSFVNSVTR